MAADYGRNLYRQYEEGLAKNDALIEANKELKREIRALKKDGASDLAAERANHRKETKAIKDAHAADTALLLAAIARLEEEVRRLRAMIDKNSSNSSKPPSSDGPGKPRKNIPNGRAKTGRRLGGQPGHKGNIPILCEAPDSVTDLRPDICGCGGKIAYEGNPVRKQAVEIIIKKHIREYRDEEGVCALCGKRHRVKFPAGIHNPVNIGAGLKALVSMLNVEYAMPLGKIARFVSEMTEGEVRLANGAIVNSCKELCGKIEPSIRTVKEKLFLSPVLHKDETGVKVNGERHWLHTLTAGDFAYYHADTKRGNDADEAMGVLAGYGGVLVHDHLKGLYAWKCKHAECNSHILRYLIGVLENEPEYAAHAEEMSGFFVNADNERKEAKKRGEAAFPDDRIKSFGDAYDGILRRWEETVREVTGKAKSKKSRYKREGEKLCPRLAEYKEQHLLFLRDSNVPFDNNLAERSLRGIKTKTKVSGGFRVQLGADTYAGVRTYIETLRRHKQNIFRGITSAFAGNPVLF
ncbi:MAG: IS66 family transposase [Clostridiales Family XIII bacterium]|jgi:transposase|nr:IS66 family transposase [Clostridiales Family XIII bacterium]